MTLRDEPNGRRSFALPGSKPQYGPDKTVSVEHIDLHLTPDLERQRLDGICTTTVRALDEDVDRLALDAVDLDVASVARDGAPLQFERRDGKLEIRFEPPVRAGEAATFAITYATQRPRRGLFFIGPDDAHPEKPRTAWTQSQDENARYWFPCLDYPGFKQTTSQTIVVPKGQIGLGNGALVERRDEGDTTVFCYRQDVPHSTYLVTMVVGPFVEVEQGASGAHDVPVSYYVLPGREADGERSFGNTPRMIDVFEERTGTPYPYARYSQIAVEDFIFGGMENTSATTQTDRTLHDERAKLDFSSDPLVSHELAHQWFGDLLTCRDWAHAWLNEGFATFFEAVWREENLGYDEYLYDVFEDVTRYVGEDVERYRRPIVCNVFRYPIEIFDRHLYEKGGSVLHMLRGELGEARFWRSIREYVARNAQRSVETIDLIRAIEEATGRNMRGFFDQWVFRGGHPEIELSYEWDAKRKAAKVTIDQKQAGGDDAKAFRFETEIGFVETPPDRAAANAGPGPLPTERRVRFAVERAHETVTIPLDDEPKLVRFDPGAFLLSTVTYKLGADRSAAALRGDPDPILRIRAARELAKDGSQVARDALQFAFENDPFWGTLAEAAAALGATHAPWARDLLIAAAAHKHPKVRRAVASALGNFRTAESAAALVPLAEDDEAYTVRASALTALGRTRDKRAFDVLSAALKERTWNDTVEGGAMRGLAELADARAMPLAIKAAKPKKGEGLRRAAAHAIGRIGELVESERTNAVLALEDLLGDGVYLVALTAIAAAESLGDARLLPTLDRVSQAASDPRLGRDAAEAAIRIREGTTVPAQVTGLRGDLDELREEQRKLAEKIEALSRR